MAVAHLVRHTAVAARWLSRCYGRSDVALSGEGIAAARRRAHELAALDVEAVVTSPLRRARVLAGRIALLKSLPLVIEPRLAECDFGSWEGRAWDDIWRETGNAMDGMIHAPDTFRPGGGETTREMARRAYDWLDGLDRKANVIAVCHGGPIAAIRGRLDGAPVTEWLALIPAYGMATTIEL